VKRRIIWAPKLQELLLELPERDGQSILERLELVSVFPHIYPVRIRGRRFRRHRRFRAGNWDVFYKVVDNVVYVRGLWPVPDSLN
jgi:mRNA-degrading endonuclease RelE of RelBE toxin-antitoxin system